VTVRYRPATGLPPGRRQAAEAGRARGRRPL